MMGFSSVSLEAITAGALLAEMAMQNKFEAYISARGNLPSLS
jgi:hypothetical protein